MPVNIRTYNDRVVIIPQICFTTQNFWIRSQRPWQKTQTTFLTWSALRCDLLAADQLVRTPAHQQRGWGGHADLSCKPASPYRHVQRNKAQIIYPPRKINTLCLCPQEDFPVPEGQREDVTRILFPLILHFCQHTEVSNCMIHYWARTASTESRWIHCSSLPAQFSLWLRQTYNIFPISYWSGPKRSFRALGWIYIFLDKL